MFFSVRKRRKKRYLRGTSDHLQMEDVKRTCSGMNSAVVTSCTPRSPTELSGTFSSESQSPTISTKLRKIDSQVRLVEGCQVVVELCHMEPELLSSLQPTEQVSEIEPRAFISAPVGVDLCHMDPDPSLRFSDVYSPIGSATDVTFNRCNDLDTSLSDTWGKSVSSLTPRSLRNLWLGYESEPSAVSIRKLANEPLSSHSEDPQVSMDHSYREHDSSSTVNWPPQFYEMEPSSPLSTPVLGFSDPDSLFGSVTDVTLNYGNASDTSLDETEFKSVSSFTPGFIRNLWRGLSCENEPPAVPIRDINRQSPLSSANASQVNFNRIKKEPDLPPSTAQCSAPLYESEPSPTLSPPASRISDLDSPVGSVTDVKLNYSNASDTSFDETEFKSVSSFTPGSLRNLWRGLSCENEPSAVPTRDITKEPPPSSVKVARISRDHGYMQADSPSNVQCSTKMFEMEASSPSAPASRFGDAELSVVKVIDPTSKYSNDIDKTSSETEIESVSSLTPESLRNLWLGYESEPSAVSIRKLANEPLSSHSEDPQVSMDHSYREHDSSSTVNWPPQFYEMEPSSPLSTPVLGFSDPDSLFGSVTDVTLNYGNASDTSLDETEFKSVSSFTPGFIRNLWRGLSCENEPPAVPIRDINRQSPLSSANASQVNFNRIKKEPDLPPSTAQCSAPLYESEPSPTLSPPASRISDLDSPVGSVTDVKLNYSNASDTSFDETEFKSVSSFTPGSLRNLWRGLSCENEPSAVPTRDITKEPPPSSVKVARISRDHGYMQADSPSNVQCSTKMFEMEASSPSAPASRFGDAELSVVKVIDPTSKYSNDIDKTSSETEIESVSSLTPESLRNLWRGLSYENKPQATSIRDSTRESSSSLFKVSQVEYPTSPSTVTSNVADLLSDSLSDVAINYPPSSRNVSLNSMSSVSVFPGNLSTRSRILNRTEIGEHSYRSTGASELTLLQRVLSALRAPFRPYETAESTINVQSNDRRGPSQSSHPDGTL